MRPSQFNTNGWRKSARGKLSPGDRVVLVGTMGEQTPDDMKGRLLGVMELSKKRVACLDFAVRRLPGDFVDGKYKWPTGLMNLRTQSLPQRPELREVSDRNFSMDSALGIVSINDEKAARVRALDWREEELLQLTARAQERLVRKHGGAKRATPPPTTTRRGVMHMRRAPAYTYAMRVVGARPSVFKVGWAFDYKQRARQFNHAAMPGPGGLEYKPFLFQFWHTARQAYTVEQTLRSVQSDKLDADNSEMAFGLSKDELSAV